MIYVKKAISLGNRTLRIIPIGDVHYNTDECDRERYGRLIARAKEWIAAGDPTFGIGIGDYNDAISPSERASIVAAKGGFGLHDTTLRELDRAAKRITDRFYRITKGLPFLGLCEGHHWMTFSGLMEPRKYRAASTTEYLCDLLECKFLGTLGIIDLSFGSNLTLRIAATHGYGSARTAGARVQKRVRMMEVVNANIYLMGHDDEKMVKGAQILDFDNSGRFISKKVAFVATGSFQRAYHLGRSSGDYVEQLMLPPAQLGVAIIEIRVESRKGRKHLDWHVSI